MFGGNFRNQPVRWAGVFLGVMLVPVSAHAGMPSYSLSDIVAARLEVISFFLLVALVLAFVFQRCWNVLAGEFSGMPVLNYRKSLAIIFVASLVCGLILTMISGARELMTPGAWNKVGAVYKLSDPKREPIVWLDHARRRGMEQFRDALWDYARLHDGMLPEDPFGADIPQAVWRSPDLSGTPYGYLLRRDKKVKSPDLPKEPVTMPSPDSGSYVLAYEPLTFGEERYALFSSGEIVKLAAKQLHGRVAADDAVDAEAYRLKSAKP
jgi:hypothetical protein